MFDGFQTGPALIFPEKWRRQPLEPVEIDWNHPLARDIRFCYVANQGAGKPLDLVRRRRAVTVASSSTAAWRTGPGGMTQAWTNNADYYERDTYMEPANVTLLARLRRTETVNNYSRAFNKTHSNGGSSPYVSYGFSYNPAGAGQNWAALEYNLSGTLQSINADIGDTSIEHTVIGTVGGSAAFLYRNMTQYGSGSGGTISYDTSSTGRLLHCSHTDQGVGVGGAGPFKGDIYWSAVWGRVLSETERWLAVHEPYALFVPKRPRTFFFVSGGGEPPPVASFFDRGFGRGVLRGIGGGI